MEKKTKTMKNAKLRANRNVHFALHHMTSINIDISIGGLITQMFDVILVKLNKKNVLIIQ